MRKTAIIIAIVICFAAAGLAEEPAGVDILRSIQEAFTSVAAEVSPSVVYIEVTSETDKSLSFFFGPWGFEAPPEQEAAGSGFIIDTEGYVVTNAHVVARAKEIQVTLADERIFDAEVVGVDPDSDLALIRLKDARDLPVARLGDSDDVRVGEWALAIGSPFGLQQTVTAGIISATGRTNMGLANYEDFIQTDASINPGNSGGPLVNLDGEVIGINSAIRSGGAWTGEAYNIGIGFAIPINMARRVVADLRETGSVVRGWLGVSIQNLAEEVARAMDLRETKGALVAEVLPDSPAEDSGFEVGDVVLEMNGLKVKDANELKNRVALLKPDERVEFLVNRGGTEKRIDVTIGERPSDLTTYYEESRAEGESRAVATLGLEVQNLSLELMEEMGLDEDKGVVITRVFRDSPADKAGLRSGDVILQFDRQEVKDAVGFEAMAGKIVEGEPVLVLIWRDGRTTFLVIEK